MSLLSNRASRIIFLQPKHLTGRLSLCRFFSCFFSLILLISSSCTPPNCTLCSLGNVIPAIPIVLEFSIVLHTIHLPSRDFASLGFCDDFSRVLGLHLPSSLPLALTSHHQLPWPNTCYRRVKHGCSQRLFYFLLTKSPSI